MRLLLKKAGLDARSVTSAQLAVAVQHLLPRELAVRALENGDAVCERLRRRLELAGPQPSVETPEAVFERLRG